MASLEETLKTDLAHPIAGGFTVAADGDLDKITGVGNVTAALLRRLVTSPGALVHRPNYGVGIQDFLNAPNSLENQRALAVRVKEQFEQDDRVDTVVGLRLDTDDKDPSMITIFVRVKIVGFEETVLQFVPFGETVTNG